MARKSRKTCTSQSPDNEAQALLQRLRIKVGGYVRISSESTDNDSIETQSLMIQQYVEDRSSEFELVEVYSDSGFTGTNFDRPEFERMMYDIRTGRIQCVIVKDLSRFGRNFLEAGYYIETVFPHLNARLIAINDRFDSFRENDRKSLEVPIKNMVNEMYAMDTSRKIAASIKTQRIQGTFLKRTGTYGYILDRDNNCLIKDPEFSKVVKLIFLWYAAGYCRNEIAERLNFMNVPCPSIVKEKYENRKAKYVDCKWSRTIIDNILKNQTYCGDTIYGKNQISMYQHLEKRKCSKDEWIIHENTHEALVNREIFEKANQRIKVINDDYKEKYNANKENREQFGNCFYKKLVCAECGNTLQYARYAHGQKKNGYHLSCYVCKQDSKLSCGVKVYEDYLKMIVMDQIKNLIALVCDQKKTIDDIKTGARIIEKEKSADRKIMYLSKRLVDTEKAQESLYASLADGVIDAEEYKEFGARYSSEKEDIIAALKVQNAEKDQFRATIRRFEEMEQRFERWIGTQEYNQELVDAMVEKIAVHKSGDIDICFRCEDIFADFAELIKEEK